VEKLLEFVGNYCQNHVLGSFVTQCLQKHTLRGAEAARPWRSAGPLGHAFLPTLCDKAQKIRGC